MDPRGRPQLIDEIMRRKGNNHPSTTKNINSKRRKTAHFGFIEIPEEIKYEENDPQMPLPPSTAQIYNPRKTQEHFDFESRSQNNMKSDLSANETEMA